MSYLDNYVNVYDRVTRFHEKYAASPRSITATPVPLDGGKIAVQAQLTVDGTVLSTGLSCATDLSEKKALEKAETAAIGRALSFAGFSAVGEGEGSGYSAGSSTSEGDVLTDAMGGESGTDAAATTDAVATNETESDVLTAAMGSLDNTDTNVKAAAPAVQDTHTESGLSPETQELLNKYGHNK